MAARKAKFENECKKLITCITGIHEEDENFTSCWDFLETNFKFHRFLDVDSHKLTRALQGIQDKFTIHAQDEKAEAFERLTDDFLSSPAFEDRDKGKTQTHYAVLSLLLQLSQSPTVKDFQETPVLQQQEEADSFDWKAYLLEDEDVYTGPFADSPVWSSDEEVSDLPAPTARAKSMDRSPDDDSEMPHVANADEHEAAGVAMETSESRQWLSDKVMIQYWQGHNSFDLSSNRSSTLALDWEHYLTEQNALYVSMERCYLQEYQVIREVLWMLSGVEDSFIFVWEDGRFVIRDGVRVTHLTEESLRKMLGELSTYGTFVWKLKDFVSTVFRGQQYWGPGCHGLPSPDSSSHGDGQSSSSPTDYSDSQQSRVSSASSGRSTQTSAAPSERAGNEGASQTFQAFAAAIHEYLQKFLQELLRLETLVNNPETTLTLCALLQSLAPWLDDLQHLEVIFLNGVEACCCSSSNRQRAAQLLGELYEALVGYDSLGREAQAKVVLLLPIWVKSCRPYLNIVDGWIGNGQLLDPRQEFIIQRNAKAKALDENFWDTAFTLHCAGSGGAVEDHCTAPGSRSQTAPGFLVPVLEQLILAGKSMEMLQNLGKLKEVIKPGQRSTLYETFCQSLMKELGQSQSQANSDPKVTSTQAGSATSSGLTLNLTSVTVKDPLLQLNFSQLFHTTARETFEKVEQHTRDMNSQLEQADVSRLSSVQTLLQKCLYPHIVAQHQKISACLMKLLQEQYDLLQNLSAVRRYFLMEAGDTMYDFYSELFEKLRLREPWEDASFLNMLLQDSLHEKHPQDEDRLSVSVEPLPVAYKERPPINITDGITLHYKVDWPVNVILNSRCMKVYNAIFTFLLQIKCVKYALDGLRFDALEKEDILVQEDRKSAALGDTTLTEDVSRSQLIHRMYIFRMRLLHFVNSLHNYIMTRILHSTGLEFQDDLLQAKDIDQLISIHNKYVTNLHTRCLLHRKVKFIKDVVLQVMNLAVMFQQCWDQGADHISVKTLQYLENKFSKCIQFLSSFLSNFISKGVFPHLESLAFALITSSQALKS